MSEEIKNYIEKKLKKFKGIYIDEVDIPYLGFERLQEYHQNVGAIASRIDKANLVYAHLHDIPNQTTTINLLTYAAGKGKRIWLSSYLPDQNLITHPMPVKFIMHLAERHDPGFENDVISSFDQLYQWAWEEHCFDNFSPIESKFFWEWEFSSWYQADRFIWKLAPQYEILDGKYYLDFAHVPTKIAIELDGLEAHKTTDQIANDRRRQREIEALGWRFIRFGGKEIYHDVAKCAEETRAFIEKTLIDTNF